MTSLWPELEVDESKEYRSATCWRSLPLTSSLLQLRISGAPLPMLCADPLSTTGILGRFPAAHRSGCSCSTFTTAGSAFGNAAVKWAAPALGLAASL